MGPVGRIICARPVIWADYGTGRVLESATIRPSVSPGFASRAWLDVKMGILSSMRTGGIGTARSIQLLERPQLPMSLTEEKAKIAGADATCTNMCTNLETDWHHSWVDVQFMRREIAAGRWAEK